MDVKRQVSEICATMRLEGLPLPESTKAIVTDVIADKISKQSAINAVIKKYVLPADGGM